MSCKGTRLQCCELPQASWGRDPFVPGICVFSQVLHRFTELVAACCHYGAQSCHFYVCGNQTICSIMHCTVTILGYSQHSDIQLICSMMELKVIPFPRHFGVLGLVQNKYSGLVSFFFTAGVGCGWWDYAMLGWFRGHRGHKGLVIAGGLGCWMVLDEMFVHLRESTCPKCVNFWGLSTCWGKNLSC